METIEHLPLTALRESPFNPRKQYPEGPLLELAESIRSQGVMQPAVVRPLPKSDADLYFTYEIVFGHRRTRGAALAQLERVPCIVREMTDEQAAIAQVHENMKREDVSPLEEADSYAHLRDVHGISTEKICAAVGKTKAYVYARLKLAVAAPEVRDAVATQGLSPEIALKIARLAKHELQRFALPKMRHTHLQTTENPVVWMSTREANHAIARMFDTDLDDAPFDLADAKLAKVAGACTTCPRRAGNCDGLEDVLGANICTDSKCYDVKVKEHTRLQVVEFKKLGREVVDGDAAKKLLPYAAWTTPTGFVNLSKEAFTQTLFPGHDPVPVTFAEAVSRAKEFDAKVVGIVNPHDGTMLPCLHRADADALLLALGQGEDDGGADTPSLAAQDSVRADRAAFFASLTPAERVCFDRDAWERVRKAIIWGVSSTPRSTDDMRLILRYEFDMAGEFDDDVLEALGLNSKRAEAKRASDEREEEFDEAGWPRDWLATATADELGTLLTAIAVNNELSAHALYASEPSRTAAAERVRLALSFGVDPADYAPRDKDAHGNSATDEAGSAGEEAKDEPADAGVERDPNTSDMFEGTRA